MTNIATVLQNQVSSCPHVPAILDGRDRQVLSFAELEQATLQAAALLDRSGLRAGDAVLIFQPMSAQLYIAMLAVFRLGMVAMFIDPSAGAAHIDRCCSLYPPKGFIASDKVHLLKVRSPALRNIPVQFAIGFPIPGVHHWTLKPLPRYPEIVPCSPETPALLTFTSGSTGMPKAALRSHGFLLAQQQALADSLQLKAGDVNVATLPIFVLSNLASGVSSLIPNVDLRHPGRINPVTLMAQIRTYRPQSMVASPALLERLTTFCEQQQRQLSSVQQIFSGGAPVFPLLLDRLQQIAPHAQVVAVYGSTEAEPIAHISHAQLQELDRSSMQSGAGLLVGYPEPSIQLRILPDRWGAPLADYTTTRLNADRLPAKSIGEIVVSGEHVLPGYLHGRGDEETKFKVDGVPWHRTGDAGYLDPDGRLWLMGRCSARIQDEEGVLYPFAVEVAAQFQPGVRRTALVRVQGRRSLIVEFQPALFTGMRSRQESLEALRRSLAWANIQDYVVLRHIPVDRRHNAKIDYPRLTRLLQDRQVAPR